MTVFFRQILANNSTKLLQILVFGLFAGRAYQALFFDIPLRALFWDQNLMENLVTFITQDSWQNYVTNKSFHIDSFLDSLGSSIGILWAITALLVWKINSKTKWIHRLLYLSSFCFIFILLLDWKEHFFVMGHLLEHSSQVAIPFILLYWVKTPINSKRFRFVLKITIAITFICHGLFAINYYPISGEWITWCSNILGLEERSQLLFFLKIMGILDIIAALLLFFKPTFNIAIYYCIIWGLLTALARIVANFYIEMPLESLHDWAYQCIFRMVHGGLPLFLWYLMNEHDN